MSTWNKPLCELFSGGREKAGKRGELRAHAALGNQRFKKDHPVWVEADGACPQCLEYYRHAVATPTSIKPREHPDRDVGAPK